MPSQRCQSHTPLWLPLSCSLLHPAETLQLKSAHYAVTLQLDSGIKNKCEAPLFQPSLMRE